MRDSYAFHSRNRIRPAHVKASGHGPARGSDTIFFILMALPAALLVFVFSYIPIGGVFIAFKSFDVRAGFFRSPWVGLSNFEFFFSSIYAARVFRNTLLLRLLFLLCGNVTCVAFALMMYELRSKRLVKLHQTIALMPSFLSWVVIGYITYALLSPSGGALNTFLGLFGCSPIQWYTKPTYWPIILLIAYLWNGTGSGSLFYFASLTNMDQELLEAAQIDGANRGQLRRYILLPQLYSLLIIMNILNVGHLLQSDFGLFFNLTRNQSALYATTDVIETYVYRALIQWNDVGMSAAVSLFQSMVGFVLVLSTNLIVRKLSPENAMF